MEFKAFNKIPRLSRDMVITEKLDGTNAQVFIASNEYFEECIEQNDPEGFYFPDLHERHLEVDNFIKNHCLFQNSKFYVFAGSRNRWLDTSSKGDNFGFAKWVQANIEDLLKLGEGRHYGEWYGSGIQRGYGLKEKRFALFNVKKWKDNPDKPNCCEVVPVIYEGMFDTRRITYELNMLKACGSYAVPYFMNPEGIVIYHTASNTLFKKTLEGDEKPKSLVE